VPVAFHFTSEHTGFAKDKLMKDSEKNEFPPHTHLGATEKDSKVLPRTFEHCWFWKLLGSSCEIPKLCIGTT